MSLEGKQTVVGNKLPFRPQDQSLDIPQQSVRIRHPPLWASDYCLNEVIYDIISFHSFNSKPGGICDVLCIFIKYLISTATACTCQLLTPSDPTTHVSLFFATISMEN